MRKFITLIIISFIVTNVTELFSQQTIKDYKSILQRNNIPDSKETGNNFSGSSSNSDLRNNLIDSVEITAIYCLGSIPTTFACFDTLGIRVRKNIAGSYPVVIKIRKTDSIYVTIDSAFIHISNNGTYDTLLFYKIPCTPVLIGGLIYHRDRIIVEALSGELLNDNSSSVTVYDTEENCQYTTHDYYNYKDPCVNNDGGFGFNGLTGNITARFNNYSSYVFPVVAVEHGFFNSLGGGNQPYKIVIYGDNGSGKPGSLLYISSTLTSPAGNGSSQTVSHTLTSPVNISANSRFYVGIRQNGTTNAGLSFQNENPVRSKSFFYSYPDTSNTWIDFSPGNNFKPDIAPVTGVVLYESILQEGFTNLTFPPVSWNIEYTGTNYWTRNAVSSYGNGSGSAKFDFWHAPNGTTQYLVSPVITSTTLGDTLRFDNAYAPFSTNTDTLEIMKSTNGGVNYTSLAILWGNNVNGNLNTAPPGGQFTPASSQWQTKKFALPPGINRIKFRARSGFGNNLYIDSICIYKKVLNIPLKLTLIQEGYFDPGSDKLNKKDTVSTYLRSYTFPFQIIDSSKGVIDSTDFSGNFIFRNAPAGTYYLNVKSRNTIETWSSGAVYYNRDSLISYNFINAISKAYGNNMVQVDASPARFAVYSGDINQDGTVDASDLSQVENDAVAGLSGYVNSDVTGDDYVDAGDIALVETNTGLSVSVISP